VAIKIDTLEKVAKRLEKQKNYFFKDLALDIEVENTYEPNIGIKVLKNDIKVSINEDAIRNSIKNLLNTKPGQRFLFPKFGINFEQFLFQPITDFNALLLKETVVDAVEKFEPRVEIAKCDVIPDKDLNRYDVTLILRIIEFERNIALNTLLDLTEQRFIFSPNTLSQ
jgi:phage baseplate assembly protein W